MQRQSIVLYSLFLTNAEARTMFNCIIISRSEKKKNSLKSKEPMWKTNVDYHLYLHGSISFIHNTPSISVSHRSPPICTTSPVIVTPLFVGIH